MTEQLQARQKTGELPESRPLGPAPAKAPAPAAGGAAAKPQTQPPPRRMDPVRKWVLIFGGLCLFLLAWYLLSDRYTPFTTQARINAFVVPIAPQVAGELLSVKVRTNQ